MMNESTLDYSGECLDANLKFKFASDFIKHTNAKVDGFYIEGEYFIIEFNTEENCGMLEISSDDIVIKHNVFDDFVIMRNYIHDYFKSL